MSFYKLSVTVGLLIVSAAASPYGHGKYGPAIREPARTVSVPAKLKINLSGGGKEFVQKEFARAQALLTRHKIKDTDLDSRQLLDSRTVGVPLTNGGTSFTAEVGVGNPPKKYSLLIDTGSSNTFLSTHSQYQRTASATNTTHKVQVSYGSGNFEGYEFTDDVTLGDVVVKNQSIGISEKDKGLEKLDGLFGLGPEDLTKGTVEDTDVVPTVVDNLFKQGLISAAVLGISLAPSAESDPAANSLSFGAPDGNQFTGDVTYVPITKKGSASEFWGIDQSVSYGSSPTKILESAAGIVDSGTTLVMLATPAYQAYVKATGASLDKKAGLLKLNNATDLQSLFFHIGDKTFEFTANAQMWPHIHNEAIDGDAAATYLIVAEMPAPAEGQSHSDLDFILGLTFLQRFYTIYDTTDQRVGFATTRYTNATSN